MTKAGLMPPWMPGADSAALVGRDRPAPDALPSSRPSPLDGRRARPLGTPGATAHSKPFVGVGLGGPGRTITLMPPKAYSPHAAGGGIDDYHCFLLDPKLEQDAFVTAALIRPQRTGHRPPRRSSTRPPARRRSAARQLNAAHGGKGWSCFGGPDLPVDLNATGAIDRLGQPPWIAAWVPGHTTNALPRGTGVLLHKGATWSSCRCTTT